MHYFKGKTVFFKNGEKYDVVLPPMHYDSYRVIDDEIWWMKPLSKDKEDESFTIYKGMLMEKM